MNKRLLILAALSLLITGCTTNNTNNTQNTSLNSVLSEADSEPQSSEEISSETSTESHSSSESVEEGVITSWPEDLENAMLSFIEEVLPVAPFDAETFDYGFNEYNELVLCDDNLINIFPDYNPKLIAAGYSKITDNEGYECYQKIKEDSLTINVYCAYFEATDSYNAGNQINISATYPITEDYLLSEGYELIHGWPTSLINETIDGTDSLLPVPAIESDGDWYVSSGSEDEDDGSYYLYTDLAIKGEHEEEYLATLLELGYEYDDYFGCAYDPDSENGHEIYFYDMDGFFLVFIYGPYLYATCDVASEKENNDGTREATFMFAGQMADGTLLDGVSYETDSVKISFSKNENNLEPKYYANGQTVRFYPQNSVTITDRSVDFDIDYIELYIGSSKSPFTGAPSDFEIDNGTLESNYEIAKVYGLSETSVTVTFGSEFSKGNLGISQIIVYLVPDE